MPLAAKCTQECTTPQHGYVAEGRDVVFELPEWKPKRFPYLKHFEQKARAKNPQPSIDEGATAAALKAAKKAEAAQPLGVAAPAAPAEAVAEVVKLSAMSPEELDDVKTVELLDRGVNNGLDLDAESSRTDLIIEVMAAEDKAAAELFS